MPSVDTNATVTRALLVPLTESELLARGNELAHIETRIAVLKSERAAISTRIKTQENERTRLSRVVDAKEEPRATPCRWYPDWAARTWRLRRQDTHVEIETCDMTAMDRQLDLEGQEFLRVVPKPTNDNGQPKQGA